MPKLGSGVTFRLETHILAKYKNINIHFFEYQAKSLTNFFKFSVIFYSP